MTVDITKAEGFRTDDGTIFVEVFYGDGTMPPFFHVNQQNIDPNAPGVTVAMSRDDLRAYGRWLVAMADTAPDEDPTDDGVPSPHG